MKTDLFLSRGSFAAIFSVTLATCLSAGDEPPPRESAATAGVRPRWQVGDQWTVETHSLTSQSAVTGKQARRPELLQWSFKVQGIEKLGKDPCFVVVVQPQLKNRPQPVTRLWVDQRSLALRQVESQLPTQQGFATLTESYQFPAGQASPVMVPLPALPLDLPVFLGDQSKGLHKFGYVASAGPHGAKALGETNFAFSIEQSITLMQPAAAKALAPAAFVKDLPAQPLVEVKLKSYDGAIHQVWRGNDPWPLYANNGVSVSRLVKVTRAAKGTDEKRSNSDDK